MILMAGCSALLVAAAASRLLSSSSSSSSSPSSKEYSEAEVEVITADDVCKIFDRLFMEMQSVLASLSQQVQQIQMSGQHIPEAQLRQILTSEFERALLAKQAKIFQEFDVDADCLEEAVWEFMQEQHANVVKSVERFQRLYENVSGESIVGRRPGKTMTEDEQQPVEILDPTKTVEAAEAYFGALTNAMKDLVDSFHEEGKDLNDRLVAQELSMKFASVANEAGEEALDDMGVSLKSFQASVETHSTNPTVGRALTMLQVKQQQDLMNMGVPAM
jgi:hypothetical protein